MIPTYKAAEFIAPSPMEIKIINLLTYRNIKFLREVIFDGCINSETGISLRYDFYLPDYNLILEYDGRNYHFTDKAKQKDKIKNEFARKHKIALKRLKNRADVVIFFNKIEKLKKHEPASKAKPIVGNDNGFIIKAAGTSGSNLRLVKTGKLLKEIKILDDLKKQDKDEYVKRIQTMSKKNKSMLAAVMIYYKNKKDAA